MNDDPRTPEQERRRYFRIEDQVGLVLERVSAAAEQTVIDAFASNTRHTGLLNELRGMRYEHLPVQRSLEHRFPTVAAYIHILERQIDMLALVLDERTDFPALPDQHVNLSAQGLSLHTAEEFALGSLVSVKLALFPGPCRIETLARVVRCEGQDTGSNLALEFTHLRDVDREALIRHVCHLERQQLQARAHR